MKTTWQKIYSFFGFWTYYSPYYNDPEYIWERTLYWVCPKWMRSFWYCKIDIVSWKVKNF